MDMNFDMEDAVVFVDLEIIVLDVEMDDGDIFQIC